MIDETVGEIADMQSHSSSEVAIRATTALRELLDREYSTVDEFSRDLERNSAALRRANPSHVSLFNAQREVVDIVERAQPETIAEAKAELEAAIDDVVTAIETSKSEAANHAAELLDDGMTVLTHDYSTTVIEAIERAASTGTRVDVFVTEARPRLLGRKTARHLASVDGVSVTLIVDSAAGWFLDDCDIVLLGMTCIVERTVYNRVGTFPVTATAKSVETPVYVTGSSGKIVQNRFRFENDFRTAVEVMLEPPEGFSVKNPAYDATPITLLADVITDEGPYSVPSK